MVRPSARHSHLDRFRLPVVERGKRQATRRGAVFLNVLPYVAPVARFCPERPVPTNGHCCLFIYADFNFDDRGFDVARCSGVVRNAKVKRWEDIGEKVFHFLRDRERVAVRYRGVLRDHAVRYVISRCFNLRARAFRFGLICFCGHYVAHFRSFLVRHRRFNDVSATLFRGAARLVQPCRIGAWELYLRRGVAARQFKAPVGHFLTNTSNFTAGCVRHKGIRPLERGRL